MHLSKNGLNEIFPHNSCELYIRLHSCKKLLWGVKSRLEKLIMPSTFGHYAMHREERCMDATIARASIQNV